MPAARGGLPTWISSSGAISDAERSALRRKTPVMAQCASLIAPYVLTYVDPDRIFSICERQDHVPEQTMRKDCYFGDFDGPGWPAPDEVIRATASAAKRGRSPCVVPAHAEVH